MFKKLGAYHRLTRWRTVPHRRGKVFQDSPGVITEQQSGPGNLPTGSTVQVWEAFKGICPGCSLSTSSLGKGLAICWSAGTCPSLYGVIDRQMLQVICTVNAYLAPFTGRRLCVQAIGREDRKIELWFLVSKCVTIARRQIINELQLRSCGNNYSEKKAKMQPKESGTHCCPLLPLPQPKEEGQRASWVGSLASSA